MIGPPPSHVTLTVLGPGNDICGVRKIEFPPERTIRIGRASTVESKRLVASDDNAIFDCKVMSRDHAVIEAPLDSIGRVYLKDNSKFGTWINDCRVPKDARTELSEGNFLSFGHTVVHSSDGVTHEPVRVMVEFIRMGPLDNERIESLAPQRLNTFTCPSASSSDNDEGYEPSMTGSSYYDDGSDQDLAEKEIDDDNSKPTPAAVTILQETFDALDQHNFLYYDHRAGGPRGRWGTPRPVSYSNSERSTSRSSSEFDIPEEAALLMQAAMSAPPTEASPVPNSPAQEPRRVEPLFEDHARVEPLWEDDPHQFPEFHGLGRSMECDIVASDERDNVRDLSPELGTLPWTRYADQLQPGPPHTAEVIDCDALAEPEVCEIGKQQWLSSQQSASGSGDLAANSTAAASGSHQPQPTPTTFSGPRPCLPKIDVPSLQAPRRPFPFQIIANENEKRNRFDSLEANRFSRLSSLQKLKAMRTELQEAMESVKDIMPDLPPLAVPSGPPLDPAIIPYESKMNMFRSLKESAKAYKACKPMVDQYRSRVAIQDLLNTATDATANEIETGSNKPAAPPAAVKPDRQTMKRKAAVLDQELHHNYDLSRSTQTDQPTAVAGAVSTTSQDDGPAVPRSAKRLRTVFQKAASATAFAALGSIATIGFLASPIAERLAGF